MGISNRVSGQKSLALGQGNDVSGTGSYAIGYFNDLSSGNTIALGRYLKMQHNGSMGAGIRAYSSNTYQFVWNPGSTSTTAYFTPSGGKGSFNINPENGLRGFYVGTDDFVQCVLSAVKMMDPAQLGELKTALGIS